MLPEASSTNSTLANALAAASETTRSFPRAAPSVTRSDALASVALLYPVEYRSSYSPAVSGASMRAGFPRSVYA
jgi:hypothetical protein